MGDQVRVKTIDAKNKSINIKKVTFPYTSFEDISITPKEFESKIMFELKFDEINLINTNIYYNEKYIDYYMDYHCGNYQKCWDFLMKHRDLLTPEHTPEQWRHLIP